MSMITEKRNEVAKKLNDLLVERKTIIEDKVTAFRISLESEPMSEEILNTKKLLVALDEVIACENQMNSLISKHVEERNEIIKEEVVKAISEDEKVIAATPEVTVTVNEPVMEVAKEVEEVVDCVEITVDPETKETEVKTPVSEARPGMAYVGIPERR